MKASPPLLLTAAALASTGAQAGICNDVCYSPFFSMPSFMQSMVHHSKVMQFGDYTEEISFSKSWSITKTAAWGCETPSFGTVDYTIEIDFTRTWTTHSGSTTYLSDTDLIFAHPYSTPDSTDESGVPSEATVVSKTTTKTITTHTTFELPTDHHFPPIFNDDPLCSFDFDCSDFETPYPGDCSPTDNVPEPTSLALLGSGALIMLHRRRH